MATPIYRLPFDLNTTQDVRQVRDRRTFRHTQCVCDRLEHLKPGMDLGVLARIVDDVIDDCIDVHERLLKAARTDRLYLRRMLAPRVEGGL